MTVFIPFVIAVTPRVVVWIKLAILILEVRESDERWNEFL